MHVKVHYQGVERSPWVDQFVNARVSRLNRYLNPAANVEVHLKQVKNQYVTSIAIHNYNDFAFNAYGENLFEAFSAAIEKANRALNEHKNKLKDKIHKKFARATDQGLP